MSRPRFDKLPREKREQILETAAQEFAAHGFENASLNHILIRAGVSKGAAYYYFDDKADLFATAVSHFTGPLVANLAESLNQLTADNFWQLITANYQEQMAYSQKKPWLPGLLKSVNKTNADAPVLKNLTQQLQEQLRRLLQQGQQLGVIRQDLPEDLLLQLFMAVDDAHDQWLLTHWQKLEETDKTTTIHWVVDNLRRLLSKP